MDRGDREKDRIGFKSCVLPGEAQTDLVLPSPPIKTMQTTLELVPLTRDLTEVLGQYLFNTKTRDIIISMLIIFTGEIGETSK